MNDVAHDAERGRDRTSTRVEEGERAENVQPHARETGHSRTKHNSRARACRVPPSLCHLKLTRKQAAVMQVLLNPEHFAKTDTDKMQIAGVGRRRWYEIVTDPTFQAARREIFLDLIGMELMPVIDAAIRTACIPTGEGTNDRMMLLTMAGMVEHRPGNARPRVTTTNLCGIVSIPVEQA